MKVPEQPPEGANDSAWFAYYVAEGRFRAFPIKPQGWIALLGYIVAISVATVIFLESTEAASPVLQMILSFALILGSLLTFFLFVKAKGVRRSPGNR